MDLRRVTNHTVLVLFVALIATLTISNAATAALVTDPDDGRTWQGASVGTFAALLYGADNLANRTAVVNAGLLDDATFNTSGVGYGTYYGNVTGAVGFSFVDGTYGYGIGGDYNAAANGLDWRWIQDLGDGGTSWTQGNVWDLGGLANQAVVFPIVDHGPLPQEAIEYSVYLSNNPYATTLGSDGSVDWVFAQLSKVYLEGWDPGQIADGFTTVWSLPGGAEFRYVNVFAGGPGSLIHDGDDEIDAVAGLHRDGTPSNPTDGIPEPSSMLLIGLGVSGLGFIKKFKRS